MTPLFNCVVLDCILLTNYTVGKCYDPLVLFCVTDKEVAKRGLCYCKTAQPLHVRGYWLPNRLAQAWPVTLTFQRDIQACGSGHPSQKRNEWKTLHKPHHCPLVLQERSREWGQKWPGRLIISNDVVRCGKLINSTWKNMWMIMVRYGSYSKWIPHSGISYSVHPSIRAGANPSDYQAKGRNTP